jgi:hypothetical protein
MKSKLGGTALLVLLVLPATALGGVLPPEDENWQDGTSVVSTPLDDDDNDVAEVLFFSVFIKKCGSVAPFDPEGSETISPEGKFSFKDKIKNLAGERYKLTVKGEFKSPTEVVEKVTIKKGKCEKTKRLTLHAF